MRPARVVVVLLCALVVVGCPGLRPKLTKHYEKVTFEPALGQSPTPGNADLVSVTAFVSSVRKKKATRTVFDLESRAQAAYVERVADYLKDTKSPSQLAAALGAPIAPSPKASVELDRSLRQKQVVLSVETGTMRPASRLMQTTATISLQGAAKFRSWNRLATEYGTVDLGALTFSQDNKFTLAAELAAPQVKELSGLQAGAEVNRSLVEVQQLSRRYRVISGTLKEGEARLTRVGVPGIDLSGNTVVDLNLEVVSDTTAVYRFASLFTGGNANPGDKVKVRLQRIRYARDACTPITATVRLDYLLRHVEEGHETHIESDDVVVIRRRFAGHSSYDSTNKTATFAPFEFVPAQELEESVFVLRDHSTREVVEIDTVTKPVTVNFDSHAEAEQFLLWLKAKKGDSVQSLDLYLGGVKIDSTANLDNLRADEHSLNAGSCP